MAFGSHQTRPGSYGPVSPVRTDSGNVFAMLFAAVALTGVLANVGMQTLTGPVTSITRVTQKNIADNNLLMNGKILVTAAVSGVSGGDPDNDGIIEPAPFVAPGGGEKAPAGGGFLPMSLGLALTDPWGSRFGYCVWDHGTVNTSSGRIAGDSTETAVVQPVIAIIAAGPDKLFQSACSEYEGSPIEVTKDAGSDDLIFRYTYAEATASSNGLWTLNPTDQAQAQLKDSSGSANVTIDRSTGVGRFFGIVTDTLAAATSILTVDGGLKLDTQSNVTACTAAEAGVVRYNAASSKLEVCNGSLWKPAGSSEATYITQTPSDDLDSEQALSLLPSGVMKVTTGTGAVSSGPVDLAGAEASGILAAGRFPALTGEVNTSEGSLETTVADDVLDFSELKDAMTLDAPTDIAVGGSDILSITNTGTGPSLVVNDEAADTTPFVIAADGNVGIGTATPTLGTLQVSGNGDARIVLEHTGGAELELHSNDGAGLPGLRTNPQSTALSIQDAGNLVLARSAGSVGIGTTQPYARLDVAGGVKPGEDSVCNTNKAGMLAWNLSVLQLCDGTGFRNLRSIEKLDDIGDVYLSESGAADPNNNDLLTWNGVERRWEARNVSTVGAAVAIPGGSNRQVQFNDAGTLAGAAQLYWDKTSSKLGIGTATPDALISIAQPTTTEKALRIKAVNASTANLIEVVDGANSEIFSAGRTAASGNVGISVAGLPITGGQIGSSSQNMLISIASRTIQSYGSSALILNSAGNDVVMTGSNTKVGIGTAAPHASAKLDVTSTTLGFLPPRMTTAQVNAIASPANGLLVYDNDVGRYKAYQGDAWQEILTSATGNITDDSLDFDKFKDAMTLDASTDIAATGTNVLSITNTGTADSFVVNDEVGDTTPFVIDASGNVGVGTATPGLKLDVAGGLRATYQTTSVVHGWGNTLLDLVGVNGSSPGTNTGRFHIGYNENDPAIRLNATAVQVYSGSWIFTPKTWFPGGITSTHNTPLALDGMTNGVSSGAATDIIRFTQRDAVFAKFYDPGAGLNEFRIWQQADADKYIYLRPGRDSVFKGGNLGIDDTAPNAKLVVAGGARVGADAVCSTAKAGMLVWNSNTLQVCTDTGSFVDIATSAGVAASSPDSLDFTEFKDAMTLDASTDIAATGTNELSITNTGTGDSLVVNDEANDTTPFVVDASGNVGIGKTSPSAKLDINGTAKIQGSNGFYFGAGGIVLDNQGAMRVMGYNAHPVELHTENVPRLHVASNGNIGIALPYAGGVVSISPSYTIGIGGGAARTIGMERHTTANTAGNNLTLLAGGATSGATDKAGGDLVLQSGTATGTGTSNIVFKVNPAGSTGTTDTTPATAMTVFGNKTVRVSNKLEGRSSIDHVTYDFVEATVDNIYLARDANFGGTGYPPANVCLLAESSGCLSGRMMA